MSWHLKRAESQRDEIEKMAQLVLDARENHKNVLLADMYKEKNFLLFGDLKTAHDRLNRAVMLAYGWTSKDEAYTSEAACVAELMKMYQKLINES